MNGNGQQVSAVRPSDASADLRDSDQPPERDSGSDTIDAEVAVVRPSPRGLRRRLIASDVLAIVLGAIVATAIQQQVRPVNGEALSAEIVLAMIVVPVWVLMMGVNHLFLARAISQVGDEFRCLVKSGLMAVSFLVAVSFLAKYGALSRLWVALLFVCVTGSLAASRMIARRVFTRLRRTGRISRPVIIVGTGTDALSLFHATQRRPDLGYEVVGFTGDENGQHGAVSVLGGVEDTLEVVRRTGAIGAILSVGSLDPAVVNRLTRTLTDNGCHVTLSSSLHDIDISRTRAQAIDGRLMIYVEPTNRSRARLLLKRTFDVTIAGLSLVLTLPIMLVAAMAIRLESSGPVVYKQVRVGKDGELFEMLKLRSMCAGADAMLGELEDRNERTGPLFKVSDDPRVTRVGKFIRKTSIDELPQLWNVIRGDMSVVGPRPALPAESVLWSPDLRERLRVPPGITGMWQVSGRSEADFELYRRLDLYYVDNWSLTHDIRILFKTLFVVIAGRGAH